MRKQNKVKLFAVLMLVFSMVLANDSHNLVSEELNVMVTKEINLNELNHSFKKSFSKQLNKRECEKSIFVKKANLAVVNEKLIIDFTPRIKRQYCTRRAKTQLYEKTKNIQYSYIFDLMSGKFKFVDSGYDNKYEKFNRSLTDVIGKNSKKAIAKILLEILNLDENSKYKSAQFNADKLIFQFSTPSSN